MIRFMALHLKLTYLPFLVSFFLFNLPFALYYKKELIKPCSEEEVSYKLTELGQSIAESGGWLNHVEKIKRVKKGLMFLIAGIKKAV